MNVLDACPGKSLEGRQLDPCRAAIRRVLIFPSGSVLERNPIKPANLIAWLVKVLPCAKASGLPCRIENPKQHRASCETNQCAWRALLMTWLMDVRLFL
jgi:hypothetical protein